MSHGDARGRAFGGFFTITDRFGRFEVAESGVDMTGCSQKNTTLNELNL